MNTNKLITKPFWKAEDLGKALPNSPHAVSVALPRWQDVIDYEEKKASCINSLKAIYPRFGFNKFVKEIAQISLEEQDSEGWSSWPFPNIAIARKAKEHCQEVSLNLDTRIKKVAGLYCFLTDKEGYSAAKAFWQHSGLGASSRLAAIALSKEISPSASSGEHARQIIKKRLAKIYECDHQNIELHPSGMAAFFRILNSIQELYPKRPILQIGFPYVDVLKLPKVLFNGSHLVTNSDSEFLESEIQRINPGAIVVELPSNPMLECVDLVSISKMAHSKGIIVIADDTIGSGLNLNALPYADIVFSSLTKSFAGRGDIMAGSIVLSPFSPWRKELKEIFYSPAIGKLSDSDAIELEKASQDVFKRIPKLNQGCISLKKRLEKHPQIKNVFHPESSPCYESLMRPEAGYGCLLSFELVGGEEQSRKFYDSLEVCKGPSLGNNFTLACPYVLLAHYNELEWAKGCGVPHHLIRVSVGLENEEILWNKFEKSLQL